MNLAELQGFAMNNLTAGMGEPENESLDDDIEEYDEADSLENYDQGLVSQ